MENEKVQGHPDISVLMTTYNRSEILRKTLESMMRVDRAGLVVEFVIVNNNSTDDTEDVIRSFEHVLPIRYVFESRQGKNCALNKAIEEVNLGDLVVFTDDDIDPHEDWFGKIYEISKSRPEYKAFGGRIEVVWPDMKIPKWAYSKDIQGWALGANNHGEKEKQYPSGTSPGGGNYWVRREAFEDGHRFNENIGPRFFEGFGMGSESSFVMGLRAAGNEILYCPDVVVGHRFSPSMLEKKVICKRAKRLGRGWPHSRGLSRTDLLESSPFAWYLFRLVALLRWRMKYLAAGLSLFSPKRMQKQLEALRWIAYNQESLRVARNKSYLMRREEDEPVKQMIDTCRREQDTEEQQ